MAALLSYVVSSVFSMQDRENVCACRRTPSTGSTSGLKLAFPETSVTSGSSPASPNLRWVLVSVGVQQSLLKRKPKT